MTAVDIGMPRTGGPEHSDPEALVTALRAAVEGEVRFDTGSRATYASDSSNYRQVPLGVVVPRTVDDAVAAVEVCARLRRPGAVPRRRHQPGRAGHQRRGGDRLDQALQPAGLGRRRRPDLRRRARASRWTTSTGSCRRTG